MAKYTLELRELFTPIKINPPFFTREEVESWFSDYKLEDYLTSTQINVINEKGVWTKEKLAHKIVNHYFMREIGFETIALFKHHVNFYMEEIMEEYLPLIYSASIEYDPLINVNFHEYFTRTATNDQNIDNTTDNTGRSTSSSSNNSSSLGVNSDTPQGQINKQTILAGQYATTTIATENTSSIADTTNTTSNSTSNSESNSETNENYDKYQVGNSGISATSQKLVLQYRDTIRALDKEIIKKLSILFMGLY